MSIWLRSKRPLDEDGNSDDHPRRKAMKFLCLVYFEPETLSALSPDEKARLDHDSMAYDKDLDRRGNYIVANALQPVRTARTVRVRRGKASATDGPFAETKEHLGGFILIDAANMDEAVDIAAGIPLAKLGSIEVRPIMDLGRD
jgi:hypothetical protein